MYKANGYVPVPPEYSAAGELASHVGNVFGVKCFDVDVNATMTDEKTLTTADRCDACGAQAYVRVVMPYGELLFCGHHANQHLDKLQEAAVRVQDERERIK
ncbi:hypothetical protein VR010_09350 [Actinomycetaceae bacterium L2_0104]